MTDEPTHLARIEITPANRCQVNAFRKALGLGPQPVLLKVNPAVARDLLRQLAAQLDAESETPTEGETA